MEKVVNFEFLNDAIFSRQEMKSLLEKARRDEALVEALRCTSLSSDPSALNSSLPRSRLGRLKSCFRGAFK